MNDYVGKLLVDSKLRDLTREAEGGRRLSSARFSGAGRHPGRTGRGIASGLWAIVIAMVAALRTTGG